MRLSATSETGLEVRKDEGLLELFPLPLVPERRVIQGCECGIALIA
jgi:hypothetical protein